MSGYFRLKQSLVIRIAMHSLEQGHRENLTLTHLFLLHSAYTASLLIDITWMDEVTVQILHKRGQRLFGSVLETRVEAGPGLGEAGALKYAE